MEIRNTSLLDSLLAIDIQNRRADNVQQANLTALKNRTQNQQRDVVDLSKQNNQQQNQFARNPNQTFLVNERIENLENGYRKLQEFESLSGRKFTRIEEVITEADRSTRTIVQQNNSGNTTLLESVFDRQEDGSFRLTQRFTDENGETNSNVQYNVLPQDRDFILGNTPQAQKSNSKNPFEILRGTSINVQA